MMTHTTVAKAIAPRSSHAGSASQTFLSALACAGAGVYEDDRPNRHPDVSGRVLFVVSESEKSAQTYQEEAGQLKGLIGKPAVTID